MADEGYFPRGSVLRRVHSERAVGLMYGQRALMIGALNPVNFVGTYQHTAAKLKPFDRLSRTAEGFETIFFGTKAEADAVLERVGKLHKRVVGELPEDAGTARAGTPYSAYDPELMLWTMAVIADSGPYFFELFVRKLSPDEKESLWQDYIRFAELFGMPREVAPPTWPEFREYYEGYLNGPDAHLTELARYIGHATAMEIPMPGYRAPAKRVHDLMMLGSLPPVVREHYRLSWSPSQERRFRVVAEMVRRTRPITPGPIRYGYNTGSFRLVANTERRRIERGKRTPQAA
jgi:uncharacterized protein (DUF2236 family)